MDIAKYEKEHFDETVDDLREWCENRELFLKCLKTHVHTINSFSYVKNFGFIKDQLYEIDDVVEVDGNVYFYVKGCLDELCICPTGEDDNFEIVVVDDSDFDKALLATCYKVTANV